MFGMGCFWGAERKFWQTPGVYSTAVGYAGGYTPNPTYREVCTGKTGHNEVVRVVFDPKRDQLRRSCSRCSGRTTIRRKECAKATMSARSIAPASTRTATRSGAPPKRRARLSAAADRCGPRSRSRPRSSPLPNSITPRITTSSTWPRIPVDTAGSAAPASVVRLASRSKSRLRVVPRTRCVQKPLLEKSGASATKPAHDASPPLSVNTGTNADLAEGGGNAGYVSTCTRQRHLALSRRLSALARRGV